MFWGFTEGKGLKSIAKIVDKKKGDDNKKLSKSEKEAERVIDLIQGDSKGDMMLEVKLEDDSKELMPLMVRHDGDCNNRVYICGQSYCGKSYMASKLARDYNKLYPKNKVALISFVEDDKNLNEKNIKNFIQPKIDDRILGDPLELEEFHDKCVILDDIEAFGDKAIIKELETFTNKLVNTGRHKNIDVIICRQKLMAGHKTSDILNGIHQIICFPKTASRFQFMNYLDRYLHLPKKTIQKIMDVPSRWVLINTSNPVYVLHSRGGFVI
jgi:hypothetical protein